ncbi:hypothetical protein EDB84DRAFT_470265 [Lactarius hengduanensis]|nr:hypothetical protein EDB84DRAFT_470265 [Lactarius hengduanensis]
MVIPERPKSLSGKQALATIGQGRLIELWDNLFGQLGQPIAQVLLTRGDISDVCLPRSLLLPCCLLPHLCTYPLTVTPKSCPHHLRLRSSRISNACPPR